MIIAKLFAKNQNQNGYWYDSDDVYWCNELVKSEKIEQWLKNQEIEIIYSKNLINVPEFNINFRHEEDYNFFKLTFDHKYKIVGMNDSSSNS